MATERNYKNIWCDISLWKILERIIKKEEERNGECSQRLATFILAKRINDAGGLK